METKNGFKDGFRVCVGNYGYYNEGYLHDAWITLPATEAEIWSFLKENRLYDRAHEEIYISDYDGIPFGLHDLFGEYCHLDELNVIAAQLKKLADYDYERLCCWFKVADEPGSLLELMNMIEDVDEVPVFGYSSEGSSALERLGRELAQEDEELWAVLNSGSDILDCFNFEKYGSRMEDCGLRAFDHFYADRDGDGPETDRYALAEIKERLGRLKEEEAA